MKLKRYDNVLTVLFKILPHSSLIIREAFIKNLQATVGTIIDCKATNTVTRNNFYKFTHNRHHTNTIIIYNGMADISGNR